MSHKWKIIFGLLFFTLSGIAIAGLSTSNSQTTTKQKVTVQTLSGIDLTTKESDASSSFTNISDNAAQAGLNDTVLYGAVTTEMINDKQKRVSISWHTMEKQRLGQSYRQLLDPPLQSSVIVDVDEIPPKTSMIAKGDLNAVVTTFNDLVDKENGQPQQQEQQQNSDQSNNDGLKSNAGRFDTGSSSSGSSDLPDAAVNTKTEVPDVTEVAECDYRIDIPGLTIYRQSRNDTMSGENGQLLSKGTCQDTGETIALTKQFGGECEPEFDEANEQKFLSYKVVGSIDGFEQTVQGCTVDYDNPVAVDAIPTQVACPNRVDIPGLKLYKQARTDMVSGISGDVLTEGTCADVGEPVFLTKKYGGECSYTPDIENRIVYPSYRITALIDGVTQIIQDCTMDLDNTIEIQSTFSDCGVTNDFINSVTYQQERLYFLNDSGEQKVRGCEDSTTTYDHYDTTATCEPVVDLANGVVFPQSRVAYKNNLGEVSYISDCAIPSGSSGVNIQEEACDPKYEHDFTNGQSYVMKRQYYSLNGTKVYLTSCGRSTETYPHLTTTTGCGVQNDDTNLRTLILGLTAINTPADGQIVIQPCHTIDTVSHVYNGYTMKLYQKYSSQVKEKSVFVVTGPLGSGNFVPTYSWTSGVSTLVVGSPFTACNSYPPNCANTPCYCNRTRWQNAAYKDYIRYDGTHFYKFDTSIIEEQKATD